MKWINQQQELDEAVEKLSRAEVIAIDTEADSLHSYFDKVCLVQISASEDDLLIDPLAKMSIKPLGAILADSAITKVLHGADYDLRILNRDTGEVCALLQEDALDELREQGGLDLHELGTSEPQVLKELVRNLFLFCYARALR